MSDHRARAWRESEETAELDSGFHASTSLAGDVVHSWMGLADLVADDNPELAATTRSLGFLAWSAVETSAPDFMRTVSRRLYDAGVPARALDGLQQYVLGDPLPLRFEELGERARVAFDELAETGTVATDDGERGLLCGLVNHAVRALPDSDLTEPAHPVLWRVRDSRSQIPEELGPFVQDAVDRAEGAPAIWRAIASLEMPKIVSGEGFAVDCTRPVHGWRGDSVGAEEDTYSYTLERCLGAHGVKSGPIKEGYRLNIDDRLVAPYYDSIDEPVDQFAFTFRLREERSRVEAGFRHLVNASRAGVSEAAGHWADQAVKVLTDAPAVVAALHGVPVGLVVPLVKEITPFLSDRIQDGLLKALSEVTFTPWTIGHLVLWALPVLPLSIWVLSSPDERRWQLHRVGEGEDVPCESRMRRDYPAHVRFNYRGRSMVGASVEPEGQCSPDLWKCVGSMRQPVVWSEPTTTAPTGFRVLVPLTGRGSDAVYVAALRAEVVISPVNLDAWR